MEEQEFLSSAITLSKLIISIFWMFLNLFSSFLLPTLNPEFSISSLGLAVLSVLH